MTHSTLAYHLLTDAQPVQRSNPGQFSPVCVLDTTLCSVGYPFVQFGSAVQAPSSVSADWQSMGEPEVLDLG